MNVRIHFVDNGQTAVFSGENLAAVKLTVVEFHGWERSYVIGADVEVTYRGNDVFHDGVYVGTLVG